MNYINKGKRDILIFPKFNNVEKIQEIREKYDELFNIIQPHITIALSVSLFWSFCFTLIAFPFEKDILNEELKEQLKIILKDFKPFKVKCKGISLKEDKRISAYYIFLNMIEGKDIINKIHNRIYTEILKDIDISKYSYEPHITLGTTNNYDEKIKLNDEFETIADTIVIERIGENEESIIEYEIKL